MLGSSFLNYDSVQRMAMGEIQLRMTLLGDGAVGKTSLRRQFLGKGFLSSHQMTIGADFAVLKQPVTTSSGEYDTIYQIWDLAGQDTFKSVRARFFMGALGGVCVFDLTRRSSFQNITMWIEELWRNNGKGVVPILLLGNKSDLPDRAVKRKEGEQFAAALSEKTRPHGFEVVYLETSAKNGDNVAEAFNIIGQKIVEKIMG